jgi:hypothetical protein
MVGGHPVIKLHQNSIVHLLVMVLYSLINAQNMDHIKMWLFIWLIGKTKIVD